jgi:DNA-binding FadR family transcriptional regulator
VISIAALHAALKAWSVTEAARRELPAERLWTRVADQLRREILAGSVSAGERLSSEKALTDRFGVSRNVVREALKALEGVGLLEIRRGAGGGAFVRGASPRGLNEALYSLLHLQGIQVSNVHEARVLLEPPVAAMVAERATPMDLAQLERSIERAESALQAGQRMTPALDLHVVLARMTGNPVLELLVGLLSDLVETSRRSYSSLIDTSAAAGAEVVRDHRAIVNAIARHDGERARTTMREHLLRVAERDVGTL